MAYGCAGQLLGFKYDGAAVEVVARRQDDPPQSVEISYVMRMRTTESQLHLDPVHRNLCKYGTIYNTLAASCEIRRKLIAIDDPSEQC